MSIESETVRAAVEAANKEIDLAQEKIGTLNATVRGLQQMCPHEWRYQGQGYHGSDKGTEYYTCALCGAKKEEG